MSNTNEVVGRPVYSVIIPHWNCLTKLERCLLSIPERVDVQVIVVDDVSTNCTLRDIELLKRAWGDFLVLTTGTNRGGGGARNVGLEKATGKWLVFADADDYFTEDAFNNFDAFASSEAEIVFFHCKYAPVEGFPDTKYAARCQERRYEAIKEYKEKKDITGLSKFLENWGKMFSNNFIKTKRIRFEETTATNDAYFTACAFVNASKVLAGERLVYIYISNEGTTSTIITKQSLLDRLNQRVKINKLYLENGFSSAWEGYATTFNKMRRHYGLLFLLKGIGSVLRDKHSNDKYVLRYFKSLIKSLLKHIFGVNSRGMNS